MEDTIVKEIVRRFKILVENSSPGDINTGMSGSRIRFDAALNLLGETLVNPPVWKDAEYKKPVMSEDDYLSSTYNDLLDAMHTVSYDNVNEINQYPTLDFDRISKDPIDFVKTTNAITQKISNDRQNDYNEWMKDFKKSPKILKKDLERDIKIQAEKLRNCQRNNLPKFIIETVQEELEQLMTDLKDGNWAKTPEEQEYTKQWHLRNNEYYKNQYTDSV